MMVFRVAVVGAGLAGLAAAIRLRERGCIVEVFEARDRVGGRVWSEALDTALGPAVIERGAEFVLHGYDAMRRLLERVDLSLVDTGMSYYVRALAETPEIGTDEIASAGRRAAEIARSLSGMPTAAEAIKLLDSTPALIEALRARIEISAAVNAGEVASSALEHAASFEPLPSWRVGGGNQRLPDRLAQLLGDVVRLRQRVRSVSYDERGAVIRTETGEAVFDAVVIALPLPLVHDDDAIALPLPSWKRAVLGRTRQGHAAKLHLPLRERPATSAVMSVRHRCWNWTAIDAAGKVAPVLNGFMGSEPAMTEAGLRDGPMLWINATHGMRPNLAFDRARTPVMTMWSLDPLARGAYSAPSPGFTADDFVQLVAPVGPIYFAGEYADAKFTGLMEGAIRSGEHAADRISGDLTLKAANTKGTST
ncbi:flavin monoamine oxidase family protein [Fodinicola acaciae]|uniref:flavin monoamine oxidase family protein n=1 Tax=Fodinicola acaciae TaxID=2681555 RepID=UPI001C9E2E21|nr:NAD(P)/FAD-dependent oxidoreductase [Fodinicola acaciae]